MDLFVRLKLRKELPRVYPLLVGMAAHFLRRAGFRFRLDGDLQATAQDLAHDAVLRAWEGTRLWDPAKVSLRVSYKK